MNAWNNRAPTIGKSSRASNERSCPRDRSIAPGKDCSRSICPLSELGVAVHLYRRPPARSCRSGSSPKVTAQAQGAEHAPRVFDRFPTPRRFQVVTKPLFRKRNASGDIDYFTLRHRMPCAPVIDLGLGREKQDATARVVRVAPPFCWSKWEMNEEFSVSRLATQDVELNHFAVSPKPRRYLNVLTKSGANPKRTPGAICPPPACTRRYPCRRGHQCEGMDCSDLGTVGL
jgi:hypothetical protein